jgi:ABC-type Fe3+-hydroxamate transport system substrate-binding protein
MKRLTLFILLGVAPLGQAFPVSITDDRGKEVLIPKEPNRLVVLLPLYGQILVDLGLGGDRGCSGLPGQPGRAFKASPGGTLFCSLLGGHFGVSA